MAVPGLVFQFIRHDQVMLPVLYAVLGSSPFAPDSLPLGKMTSMVHWDSGTVFISS